MLLALLGFGCFAGIDAEPGGEGAGFFCVVGSEDAGDVGVFWVLDALMVRQLGLQVLYEELA